MSLLISASFIVAVIFPGSAINVRFLPDRSFKMVNLSSVIAPGWHLISNCGISRNVLTSHKFNHRVRYNCYFHLNRRVFLETLFFTFQWLLDLSFITVFLTISFQSQILIIIIFSWLLRGEGVILIQTLVHFFTRKFIQLSTKNTSELIETSSYGKKFDTFSIGFTISNFYRWPR